MKEMEQKWWECNPKYFSQRQIQQISDPQSVSLVQSADLQHAADLSPQTTESALSARALLHLDLCSNCNRNRNSS